MKRTINEIAQIANVAKSTVSKALNGQKGVSDKKRRKILELARSLEYEPSASAQALASSKTGTIGLLIPHEAGRSLAGSYWSSIITAIAQEANKKNYSLLILTPAQGQTISEPVEMVIRRRNVDGLIIGSEDLEPAVVDRLTEEEIPFVFIGRGPSEDYTFVDVDNFTGSEKLISYLIESGCRSIACLAGPDNYLYTRERIRGYEAALGTAGISWRVVKHSAYTSGEARQTLSVLFQEYPDLDALFITAGGDFLLDCIDMLHLTGRNNKKISLASFDDYRFFDYLRIPVCTIRQPLQLIGETAASLLFDCLAGKEIETKQHILEVELVLR